MIVTPYLEARRDPKATYLFNPKDPDADERTRWFGAAQRRQGLDSNPGRQNSAGHVGQPVHPG